MTFQELLTQVRGENWKAPERLFAIDPGETIGHSNFNDGEFMFAGQVKDLKMLMRLIVSYEPDIVVYEDYKIYPGKLQSHSFSDIPTLKTIGAIEYICDLHNIKVIKQLASTAKGFCTSEKLKEWGFYQRGKPHAMDATRHGCYALLFSKELI